LNLIKLGILTILHQSVARDARHRLVRVSAAQNVAETRQLRKVQDVSIRN